jgi:hypothetical protein
MVDLDLFDDKEEAYEAGLKEGSGNNGGFVGLIIILVILYLLFGKKIGKYEGLTAEEWADEYNALLNCVIRHVNYNDYDNIELDCY